MQKHRLRDLAAVCAAAFVLGAAAEAHAQITTAQGYTPPDDTPKINIGAVIFANYTYQDEPTVTDASPQKNTIHVSSFDITRAYINVTGSLSHWFAFRITPDIAKETGAGSSLSGSQTFRMKYAYGQVNFEDFAHGSWFRFGLQQTPYIDFMEGIYRYRFQNPIFVDREGFMTSSDYGASVRYAFPMNFGDVHIGYYNGDGYSSTNDQRGVNDQKAFQVRGTLRPAPDVPVLKGLRLTGFYDGDNYFRDSKKERFVGALTFEHPYVNFGAEWLSAKDQAGGAAVADLRREGYSIWVTPRTTFGLEGLFRWDDLDQNKDADPKPHKQRQVYGIAYWPPLQGGKSVAFLLDYDIIKLKRVSPAVADAKTFGVHTLWAF